MGAALGCGLGAGGPGVVRRELSTSGGPGAAMDQKDGSLLCAGNDHTVFQHEGIARILILFLNNLNNLA